MLNLLIVIGGIIIAGLAFYAGRLLYLLKRQGQQQAQRQAEKARQAQRQQAEYNQKILLSINTIVRATQQKQCELSEASIRICVLLQRLALDPLPDFAGLYPALHDFYQQIHHHPTHEARKSYPKNEIRQLDLQREQLEQEFASSIGKELAELLQWQTEVTRQLQPIEAN